MIGKKDTCPNCSEKVSLAKFVVSPWEKPSMYWVRKPLLTVAWCSVARAWPHVVAPACPIVGALSSSLTFLAVWLLQWQGTLLDALRYLIVFNPVIMLLSNFIIYIAY